MAGDRPLRGIATEEAFAIPEQFDRYRALARRNFMVTTSGVSHHPPLQLCVEVLGAGRIMWAIDYPYQQTPECVAFMDSAPLPADDRSMIYAGNAERAFGIPAAAAAAS